MMPWRLREGLSQLVRLPERRAARKLRAGIRRSGSPDPVIGLGGVLDSGGLIHGGAVKLLHLRDGLDVSEKEFNILYLVSSAQPDFAEDLVRKCRREGILFVWNQNGVGYRGWAGPEAERYNAPMRRLRRMADYVIYQSEFCRDSATKFLGHVETPYSILFNPVDLEKFRPPEKPLPPAPLRLLSLGTHNDSGRVFSALQCVKHLRDRGIECLMTLAGRLQWTDAEEETRREIGRLGLAPYLTLRPAFSQDEAAVLYRAHHLLIHPKYLDPCPTVVVEALASGLPVVGSRSGGMPELVPETCGALVPAELNWDRLVTPTGMELADAVVSVLPRLAAASAAARRFAQEEFDRKDWLERHREIFVRLMS